MKRRLLHLVVALMAFASTTMAQSLSVATIEATPGTETTITVNIAGAAEMTALQCNLQLPEGLALAGDITLGDAAKGHTLSTSTLASGELLIVLYDLYQSTFTDGPLLTIPVVAAEEPSTTEGTLHKVRTATIAAQSKTLSDVKFCAVVETPAEQYYYYLGTSSDESLITPDNYKEFCQKVSEFPAEQQIVSVDDEYLYVVLPADKDMLALDLDAGSGELNFKYYSSTLSKYSNTKNKNVRLTFDDEKEYVIYRSAATALGRYGVNIKEETPVTSIVLDCTEASMQVGGSIDITATVNPQDATWYKVMWSSDNASVATVDNNGKVTALSEGSTTITAEACDNSGITATCVITVEAAAVEPEPEGLLTGKNYRVKNVTTGLYLQVEGNNTNMKLQNKAEGVALMQVFQLEDAAEGMYYITAADADSRYYAHASSWNFNATTNADNKTPFTIALVEGETQVYTLHQNVSANTGLAGTDDSAAGAAIYCDKGIDNNGKWTFEPLTEEENAAYVTTLTATAKAALDAALARGEQVVATRSAVLTAEELAAINGAVQAAKEGKDAATEVAALKALSDAIHTAVDAAIYVWSIDEVNSEVCYAVSTEDRGAWYAQATHLTSTTKAGGAVDVTDKLQQFAFVQSPETGALYLYSVSEEKFVKKDGDYTALTEAPEQTITILNGTRSAAFPWVVALNAEDGQKQMGISNGYDPAVITHWNDLGDGGNTVRIEKASTFDATAALAAIKALETGIDELKGENGKVKTALFDLSGRRVQKATKGIYIVNGKKVVIR